VDIKPFFVMVRITNIVNQINCLSTLIVRPFRPTVCITCTRSECAVVETFNAASPQPDCARLLATINLIKCAG
jgi:hypothetical protein